MIKEQEIPKFLFEFISFYRDTLFDPSSIGQMFYFGGKTNFNDHIFQTNFFISSYLIAKKTLNVKFRKTDPDTAWVVKKTFNTEPDFLSLSLNEKEILNIPILFDMPVFWYNNETGKLGKSVLPGAFEMIFSTFPNTVIYAKFHFALFSNHIRRLPPYDESNPMFYYFEPAAKLNRELMRNFALSMKENCQELIVELYTDRYPAYPRDDYGFLDGADFDNTK
jgi:hypothetical protein